MIRQVSYSQQGAVADGYTDSGLQIPCSLDQANAALNALRSAKDGHAEAVLALPESDLDAEGRIRRFLAIHRPPQAGDVNADPPWDFVAEAGEDGLWVYSESSIKTRELAVFAQGVLHTFDLPHLLIIEGTHACADQLDAYGGHACAVTKDFIRWQSSHAFVEAEKAAHAAREQYFLCALKTARGRHTSISQFLLVCTGPQNPAQQLESILRDEFGEVSRDGIHWVWYEGECQVVVTPAMREVPPGDFAVLRQYLPQKQYLPIP